MNPEKSLSFSVDTRHEGFPPVVTVQLNQTPDKQHKPEDPAWPNSKLEVNIEQRLTFKILNAVLYHIIIIIIVFIITMP